jgi:hypothetical protein
MFEMKTENGNDARCIGMFWVNKIKNDAGEMEKILLKFFVCTVNGIHAIDIYCTLDFATEKVLKCRLEFHKNIKYKKFTLKTFCDFKIQ